MEKFKIGYSCKNKALMLVIFGIIILTTSCGKEEFSQNQENKKDNIKIIDIEKKDEIKEMVDEMTIEEKVGQLIIAGFSGTELQESTEAYIMEKKLGGIIFFGRNVESHDQLKNLVKSIEDMKMKYGMFLAVDEEGGRVSRLPKPKIQVPSNYKLGEMNNPELAYEIGRLIGEEMNDYGLNIDFAPVIDVWSNPENTVIGDRAFSEEAEVVSLYGVNMVNGFRDKGVISVVKHFPGHGDTVMDSHKGLPVLQYTLEELENRELIPFKKAIENDVEGIMVGHLLLPKIAEDGYPASMSKSFIEEILRKKMGFKGLVITDDMDMGAIENNYGMEKAAVQSLKAGADILLICHKSGSVDRAIEAILKEIESGKIDEKSIDEKITRILRVKKKYHII